MICAIEIRLRLRQLGRVKFLKFLPLVVLVLVLAVGCKPPVDDGLPKEAQPKLRTMKIFIGAETLDAELALTPKEEQTGMMFRTNIQETDAMLFVLPYDMRASFWMKNCPESISAAYITPNGVIAEIHHLEQNNTNGVLSATDNIRFVLETKEGWFTRHNISTGTVIITEKGSLAETFLPAR
jgi:uncharacterized membrane protein (UPF0127 family)